MSLFKTIQTAAVKALSDPKKRAQLKKLAKDRGITPESVLRKLNRKK